MPPEATRSRQMPPDSATEAMPLRPVPVCFCIAFKLPMPSEAARTHSCTTWRSEAATGAHGEFLTMPPRSVRTRQTLFSCLMGRCRYSPSRCISERHFFDHKNPSDAARSPHGPFLTGGPQEAATAYTPSRAILARGLVGTKGGPPTQPPSHPATQPPSHSWFNKTDFTSIKYMIAARTFPPSTKLPREVSRTALAKFMKLAYRKKMVQSTLRASKIL